MVQKIYQESIIIYLHSNMVLFKSNKPTAPHPLPIFTFQYGSIQIKCKYLEKYNEESIYIPIWFYSNGQENAIETVKVKFTFQYGSIQIGAPCWGDSGYGAFTFQYGSIQIRT